MHLLGLPSTRTNLRQVMVCKKGSLPLEYFGQLGTLVLRCTPRELLSASPFLWEALEVAMSRAAACTGCMQWARGCLFSPKGTCQLSMVYISRVLVALWASTVGCAASHRWQDPLVCMPAKHYAHFGYLGERPLLV